MLTKTDKNNSHETVFLYIKRIQNQVERNKEQQKNDFNSSGLEIIVKEEEEKLDPLWVEENSRKTT
jgi:hypothetical protein